MFRPRGPMPRSLRLFVLFLFALVATMVVVPPLVGVPMVGAYTVEVLEEYAPAEEDYRLAEELAERSDRAGVDMRYSPQQIAHARRTGRLEDLEERADRVLDERGAFETIHPHVEPSKMDGAFYRDEPAAPAETAGLPWGDITLAFVLSFLFLLALGAAFLHLSESPDSSR